MQVSFNFFSEVLYQHVDVKIYVEEKSISCCFDEEKVYKLKRVYHYNTTKKIAPTRLGKVLRDELMYFFNQKLLSGDLTIHSNELLRKK